MSNAEDPEQRRRRLRLPLQHINGNNSDNTRYLPRTNRVSAVPERLSAQSSHGGPGVLKPGLCGRILKTALSPVRRVSDTSGRGGHREVPPVPRRQFPGTRLRPSPGKIGALFFTGKTSVPFTSRSRRPC